MFGGLGMFGDIEEESIDSYTAESMFGGKPVAGMQALEQALGPDVMPGPSGIGNNAVTNPLPVPMQQQMVPGGQFPGPNTQMAPPVQVDEIQMQRAGGDVNAAAGNAGGNKAARIGNLAGGIGDLALQAYTGFSFR